MLNKTALKAKAAGNKTNKLLQARGSAF